MNLNLQVDDPSDFPTDNLQKLDRSFRCTICKEFYDGPVSLNCGHTFCSLCIRTVLPQKPECPVCRESAKEAQLRRNITLSEAIAAWQAARSDILKYSLDAIRSPPLRSKAVKRKRDTPELDTQSGFSSSHRPKSPQSDAEGTLGASGSSRPKRARRLGKEPEVEVIESSDVEEIPEDDKTVQCPLCSNQVLHKSINDHIDSNCKKWLAGAGSSKAAPKVAWQSLFKGAAQKLNALNNPQDAEIPTERLPKVSYGTMKLTALRKLLMEKGLSNTGDKDELVARYDRWIALWNANLDRAHPKSIGELKSQLDETEAISKRPAPKVEDAQEYLKRNNDQFKSLIKAAREKAESKRTEEISTQPEQPQVSVNKEVIDID